MRAVHFTGYESLVSTLQELGIEVSLGSDSFVKKLISSNGNLTPETPRDPEGAMERHLYCPACSTRLVGRSCKQRCLKCGYFESCADL